MTNEEKAKSLWYHFCTEKSCNGHDDCKLCPKSQVHPQLLEMAAWKEQQVIEKTINFFNENHHVNCGWIDDVQIDEFEDEYVKYMKGEKRNTCP